ncbi:hypothetical protein MBLNU230_g1226t1 [Neophaeotheca triangularis]
MLGSRDRDKGRPPPPSPTYMTEEQMGQASHMSLNSSSFFPPQPQSQPRPSSQHAHSPSKASRLRDAATPTTPQDQDLPSSPTASYLQNLRSTPRLNHKPSGSRPPPPSKFASLRRTETEVVASKSESIPEERPGLATSNSAPVVPAQRSLFSRPSSSNLAASRSPFAGRPAVPQPARLSEDGSEKPSAGRSRPNSAVYMENGRRWMEKQEASSVRQAMQDMDLEEERKVHSSAQDEAAELVYKHQNPGAVFKAPEAAYRNPEAAVAPARDYRQHLSRGSYERSHSREVVPKLERASTDEGGSKRASIGMEKRSSLDTGREVSPPPTALSNQKKRTPSGKSYGGLAEAVASDVANARRRTSSGGKRLPSAGKKVFMHPNDHIYEDPEERIAQPEPEPAPAPVPVPAHVRKNPFARVRMQQERLERANSAPVISSVAKHDSIEIQRNPPTQSRKAWYTANEPLPPTPPSREVAEDEVEPKTTPTKDGREIRSDDLRAATSKQRKDFSPKLPRPTYVSDAPGRPIVSFKPDWQPREIVMEEMHTTPASSPEPVKGGSGRGTPTNSPFARQNIPRFEPPKPAAASSGPMPPIPTICLPDEPESPSRKLDEEPEVQTPGFQSVVQPPKFSAPSPDRPSPHRSRSAQPPPINTVNFNSPKPTRNLPQPPEQNPKPRRPLPTPTPHHAATSPLPKSTPHFTPIARPSGAVCASCALPIAGRVLSAAGERFHPACFKCHECETNLELVAFYPEPQKQRTERLERIHARQTCTDIPIPDNKTAEDVLAMESTDGLDSTLRFYCHLDFHELFSPRCKSCKTPIEGEVIVACGAEWHQGHFFCAQCGDPFDSSTPFVEKDQYAWNVMGSLRMAGIF